jgi:hypothetical protein
VVGQLAGCQQTANPCNNNVVMFAGCGIRSAATKSPTSEPAIGNERFLKTYLRRIDTMSIAFLRIYQFCRLSIRTNGRYGSTPFATSP